MSGEDKLLEGHWDVIKGKIKTHWGKLTHDDLNKIDGSFDELKGRLKKIYGFTESEIKNEFNTLVGELDIDNLQSRAREKYEDIKEAVTEGIQSYFTTVKDTTLNVEDSIEKYVESNPIKSVGIALALGALLGAYLAKKK